MSVLADRLLAVHEALDTAGLPHAFGGAIALAFCTYEPRGTQDLDINVFVPRTDADQALAVLPAGVTVTRANRRQLAKDAQARVWWDTTPLDLFFNNHPFHEFAAERVRIVEFAGTTIPVLDCTSLAVFKALFNRTKDWADLEEMFAAGQLDVVVVRALLVDLIDEPDPRIVRLDALTR